MGISRLDIYEKDLVDSTLLHKALSHPARARILQLVKDNLAHTCLEFSIEIGLSQPAISQHLEALKRVKLLKHKTLKNEAHYEINYETLNLLELNTIDYLNYLNAAA